jgi:hypothetical protein
MKKRILILIVILFCNFSYSQTYYSYYFDESSEWRFYDGGWNGVCSFEQYDTTYFDGFETINGFVYYKQYRNSSITYYNHPFQGTYTENYLYGPGYVREDIDGKIWYFDTENNTEVLSSDNQEIINAQIGDLFPSQSASANCFVGSIETIMLGTIPLKKILGTNVASNSGAMEGIGYIGTPCGAIFEGVSYLNCYTKQSIEIQFGTIDCSMFPTPYRTSLGSVGNNLNNVYFKISPIPAKEVLNITSNQSLIILSINIYNTIGQSVLVNHTNNNQVDVSNLKTGTYFIKIVSDKGTLNSKFIKE